ncbi:hydrolase [Kitasatospora sp. NPDC052896]|uniref:hydrolase n=1 Tax=Kitasatospora sp. NPDC052896 TaxID=3364061 RepID=UPI0037C99DF9
MADLATLTALTAPTGPGDLLAATPGVTALAARLARTADAERRLSAETATALVDAGFARHFVPRRWGGVQGSFTDWAEAVSAVGTGCASAAWCAALYANFGRLAAGLPETGQRALWGAGPDVRIAGAVAPAGRAEPAGDGWRLTGSWSYLSGVDHADWVLLCARPDDRPETVRLFAVPRHDCLVSDTWHSLGMRGTGSNTVRVDGVYVPGHLSFVRAQDAVGRSVSMLAFVAAALGAAASALTCWEQRLAEARRDGRTPARASVEATLARCDGEVEAARLLVRRAAGVADDPERTPTESLRGVRDLALAADLLHTALTRLYRAAGTSAQSDPRIQRPWRDVTCATGHALLDFEPAALAWADHRLTTREGTHRHDQHRRNH